MKLSEAIREFVELRTAKGPRSRKTAARYQITLRIFCLCMQDPELNEIDLTHILWYFKELERLGWKPNGVNLVGIALKKFFEFCHLRGYEVPFSEQLIPIREKEFHIPRVMNLKDFKKLITQIPKRSNRPNHIRNLALLLLLWDTGARSGELCMLDENDLQFKKNGSGMALIKTEKSRGRSPIRQIFWTPETGKAIKRWQKKKKELHKFFTFKDPEALFVSILKSPSADVRGSRMNNRGVAEMMRMLSNQAGLPLVANAHSVRHSFGRDTIKSIRSDSAASSLLGHASIESSLTYTRMFGQDLFDQWKKVSKYRGSPVAKAPARPTSFPSMRTGIRSPISGQVRPIMIKTSKTGRYARS